MVRKQAFEANLARARTDQHFRRSQVAVFFGR